MLNDMGFKLQKRKLCTIKNKSRIKTHGVSNRFVFGIGSVSDFVDIILLIHPWSAKFDV